MTNGSNKAVLTAIFSNSIVTALKFAAAIITHSASMMNEAIHSLMDTINQGFLYRGLVVAERPADTTHAFGHGQKKYLWNLWSAIGLFSIGAGLGLAHAYHAWINIGKAAPPEAFALLGITIQSIWVSISVLTFAAILEGYSLIVALKEFRQQMKHEGESNMWHYLTRSDDPTLVAVVLEDSVAIIGLSLAGIGIGLSAWLGDPRWDIAFSSIIALLLALVAIFLGYINMRFLTDVRDPVAEAAFREVVSKHHEVERFHDLRSIVIDNNNTILVAEIELREEALLSGLQETIERYEELLRADVPEEKMSASVEIYIRNRAAVQATLERTEQIIEELVAQTKALAPRVSHATIEIEGIASAPGDRAPVS